MAQKKAKKKSTQAALKKAAPKTTSKKAAAKKPKAKAPVKAPAKGSAKKMVAKAAGKVVQAVIPKETEKTAKKAAPTAKQTKKEALKSLSPEERAQAALDEKAEKEITKAKKALGKAKQSLAKARMKDFGSKLGKNLANQGVEELAKKWESLFKKAEAIDSKPYRMKDSFEERTAIEHKVLGWGFVLSNQNDRLEVLFRDGIRYLISNYKP